jgi:hypothetical protein
MAREKWHTEHTLDGVLAGMKQKAKSRIEEAKTNKFVKQGLSVQVVRDCDLRASLPEKTVSCSVFANWTAFVNRAGTLIHIVPQGGEGLVRIALYYSMKTCSDNQIMRYVQSWASGRLV